MKQRTGMIIFVVVVVVVVVLFARVTMQRKKELMCELKKKIHESLFVSLFIVVLQEQRVYTSRAILFYSGTRSSPYSYRQLRGRGQLLSRRYCTHSGCLFL